MFSEDVRGILGEKIGRTFFYLGLFWNKKCGDYWPMLSCLLLNFFIRLGSCANGIFIILFGNGLHEGKHLFNGVEHVL